ncbi:restriction endonuclease subunit S [Vibrio tubiashii]|uniref:restriction endonuclease subunit S n=1 Tax=Vibrio tubiashii TaxID=29498 RepID=UPI001EFD8263|nr:restriction endonuclease subunit S [Vibrio tubiashii]MCG9582062.1 restriction endonuclease subunit S [Vibrio tubiashii]MCG9615653.1 restriction endonuclease subunit S [Vibrio tubiashii]
MVELGSIANFINGFAFKPEHWEEDGKPIIRIQNLTDSSKSFNYSSMDIPEKYHVVKGDLLVSWSATLDVFEWHREDALLNQHIFKVEPNFAKVNKDYLRYALRDAISAMLKFTRGSTMKHVNRGDFLGTKIPLPPLETQKQIAAVLEKADQLRKDCQQMEQELNGLAQSVFIDMFGDQLTSPHDVLGNVSNVVSGVTKGQKHNNKVIVKAPYMRVANVQAGYLNLNEIKEIEVKESDVEKYKLEVGDVLLTEGGDHDKLGRGAIWNGEVDNCIHQNHVFRVRLDTELYTSQWFNGYLKTDFAKRYFLKCAKKTTNLASINITQLKGLPMPDIDIKEQVRFEKIITSINSQMLSNTELAHQYDENFNALMQKAFKGELNL